MNTERIRQLVHHGESVRMEYRENLTVPSRGVYETICAFLNHSGGEILIGVSDRGEILGLPHDAVNDIRQDLITVGNNPDRFSPTIPLAPEVAEVDGKPVLYLFVPEGSHVHRYQGRVFDRQGKSDIDITRNRQAIRDLAIQRQKAYTENEVFPHLTLDELRSDLIERVRKLASQRTPHHPWAAMSDAELLRSGGLYATDCQTGKSGYTLAAVLLFGRDVVIRSIVPHYRTEALLRKIDIVRYDDRDDVRTNLLDSYDRLMAFIGKHLNDPFYLEGVVRTSLLDKLFREIVANMLIHREYSNTLPARLIIERDRVLAENGNKARILGDLTMDNYTPYPKNPVIAGIFKEIGYTGELGSGIRNINRYSQIYSGTVPKFIDKDIFQTIVLLSAAPGAHDVIPAGAHDGLMHEHIGAHDGLVHEHIGAHDQRNARILRFCAAPRTREELQYLIGMASREYFRREVLSPLLAKGELKMTLPDKPKSKLQKYVAAEVSI